MNQALLRKILVFWILGVVSPFCQPLDSISNYGTIIKFGSSHSPFPHALRKDGHTYSGKKYPASEHYSDSTIAVFVPKGFKPGRTTDMVFYFHGWNNSIDSSFIQFALARQFAEAGINAVLVFPEGPKFAPDSFGGRLEEKGVFARLVDEVLLKLNERGFIQEKQVGEITLAGHSGAYRVMAYIVFRGGYTQRIKNLILFDALYAQEEKFLRWIEKEHGRFINIYTDDGGTDANSRAMMEDMNEWEIPFLFTEENALTDEQLRKNRIVFIHSDLSHNDVISERNQFRRFLSILK